MSDAVCLLDVGNSGTKWWCLDAADSVAHGRCDTDTIVDTLADQLQGAAVLVSSVAAIELQETLSAALEPRCKQVWFAQSRSSLDGLVNSYAEPERMGVDRWLAMLAAYRRVSGRLCVVDAGSALTIDLVAADGRHEGGFIMPGTALMERALFADTRRVRYSAPSDASLAPGCSTAEAVSHGLLLAQVGAINLAIAKARAEGIESAESAATSASVGHAGRVDGVDRVDGVNDVDDAETDNPELLLCGGGAPQLAKVLDLPHTLAPSLVFEGLLRQAQLEAPGMLDFKAVAPRLLKAWCE